MQLDTGRRNIMKKALSLILSLCLIASLFIGISAGAYAEGEDKDIAS